MANASETHQSPAERFEAALRKTRGRTRLTIGLLVAAVLYFIISWASFDISGILSRANPDNAATLAQDSVSYKNYVVVDLRENSWAVNIEGESASQLAEDPPWMRRSADGESATIDLGEGVVAEVTSERVFFTVPEYGDFEIRIDGRTLEADLPQRVFEEEGAYETALIEDRIGDLRRGNQRRLDRQFERAVAEIDNPLTRLAMQTERWAVGLVGGDDDPALDPTPEQIERLRATYETGVYTPMISYADRTFDAQIRWDARIYIVAGSKIEIQRGEYGWEHFFFDPGSPIRYAGFSDVVEMATSGERIDPEMSNVAFIWGEFRDNGEWQHGATLVALFETLLMAFLGTFFAAFFGLPLAFLAAKNFTPLNLSISAPIRWTFAPIRFVTRRFFDFVRGVDMLIWSLFFNFAFGLGPLTGTLAIAFTDTGTLGKLFSEALENVDNKQIEGVSATGAGQVQRYRFGVIPQIMPIFVSQGLYFFESNIRSATIIGSLGAGGIGLLLVQGINTQQRWEYVFFLIILIVLLVVIVDTISGWLRRRLIEGGVRTASAVGAVMVALAGVSTAYLFGFDFFPSDAEGQHSLPLLGDAIPLSWPASWTPWLFSGLFAVIYLALMSLTLLAILRTKRAEAEAEAAGEQSVIRMASA